MGAITSDQPSPCASEKYSSTIIVIWIFMRISPWFRAPRLR
jgi:hypothetical protein